MPLSLAVDPRVTSRIYPAAAGVPNHPALPALVIAGALAPPVVPADVHRHVAANGWGGTWTWSIFPFHHYHPNAFEVLTVASARARVMLGGPEGEAFDVAAGDVIALPPGLGHCLLEADDGFAVCGCYPAGQEAYETIRAGEAPPEPMAARIAAVPAPGRDPLYGDDGPILTAWTRR